MSEDTIVPVVTVTDHTKYKIVLLALGVVLTGITIWGVNEIRQETALQELPIEPMVAEETPITEEMVLQRLAELAANDAARQQPVPPEEIEAKLGALAEQDTVTAPGSVSQEEIQARLNALSAANSQ